MKRFHCILISIILLHANSKHSAASSSGINLDTIAVRACVNNGGAADFDRKLLRNLLGSGDSRGINLGEVEINWYYMPNGQRIKTFRLKSLQARDALVIEQFEKPVAEPRGMADKGLLLDSNCNIVKRIEVFFNQNGSPIRFSHGQLANRHNPVAPPLILNPKVDVFPPSEKGKVAVAVIDSGVNYLLPQIKRTLAVDGEGRLIGYDYTDLDGRPFDEDFLRGALWFPLRHGTSVASVLIEANPQIKIVPIRHPITKTSRYHELFKYLSQNKVQIVNLSLGGWAEKDWSSFRDAALSYPDILIVVSSGNEASNLDRKPRFPASFRLKNMLVVMALDKDGKRLHTSNYGVNTVDVAVVADKVPGFNFDGQHAFLSGTSYAAPLVSALAARLLAETPNISIPDLKLRIIQMAQQPTDLKKVYSRYGQLILH